jgi:ketosteroid isomerase-like protein
VIRAAVLALLCGGLVVTTAQAAPRDDLLAADRAFSKLASGKGWGYAALVMATNDARLLPPGGAPIHGRAQALRNLARPVPGTLSWEPEAVSVSPDGQMGWTDGHWLRTLPNARSTGRYLSVWIKTRGGAWKVQASITTADPAPRK